jgi:hypothetical protein
MESHKRYLFQGHAIAAAANFRRYKDEELHLDNCLKNVAAAIPAGGGYITASSERQEIKNGEDLLFAFDAASATVTGDYLDRHEAFLQTKREHRDDPLGVFTACEAVLKNLSVLKRFFVADLRSQLTAEDPRHGAPVRFYAQKPPLLEGVVLEDKPVEVVIDPKILDGSHCGEHYIVTSVVKEFKFPKGLPQGVQVVGDHILKVENFGKIFFGELVIGEKTRRFTMLRFQLGSNTGGCSCCGESKPNGETT